MLASAFGPQFLARSAFSAASFASRSTALAWLVPSRCLTTFWARRAAVSFGRLNSAAQSRTAFVRLSSGAVPSSRARAPRRQLHQPIGREAHILLRFMVSLGRGHGHGRRVVQIPALVLP